MKRLGMMAARMVNAQVSRGRSADRRAAGEPAEDRRVGAHGSIPEGTSGGSGEGARLNFAKKILLVGHAAVGKTSMVRRYLFDAFSDRYVATIGTKTTRKNLTLEYEDPRLRVDLELGIWDILGQIGVERAHEIYFPGADGAIFVCDLSRPETLDSTREWVERVREICGPIPGVLAANKVDLVDDRWGLREGVARLALQVGCPWFWSSARTGENLDMVFYELGARLCEPIVARHLDDKGRTAAPRGLSAWFSRGRALTGEV